MLAAVLVFISSSVLVKTTAERYSIFQILFVRNFFSLLLFLVLAVAQGKLKKAFYTCQIGSHVLRACIGVISLGCLFYGYKALPLPDATALTFATTLFLAAFSGPMLGEPTGLKRWLAIGIGFVGLIVIVNPTGDLLHWGAIACLIYAALDAYICLKGRALALRDSSLTLTLYFAIFATLICASTLPFVWITPTLSDAVSLMVLGIGGGCGQYLITQAYRYAEASVVAPMIYSSIIWSTLFGFLIWGHIPEINTWIGCGIIILSGIYIIYYESIPDKKPFQENPPKDDHSNTCQKAA